MLTWLTFFFFWDTLDYFREVSHNPSQKDKEALLKKIKVNGANSDEKA
jgi:hypothetical protein